MIILRSNHKYKLINKKKKKNNIRNDLSYCCYITNYSRDYFVGWVVIYRLIYMIYNSFNVKKNNYFFPLSYYFLFSSVPPNILFHETLFIINHTEFEEFLINSESQWLETNQCATGTHPVHEWKD